MASQGATEGLLRWACVAAAVFALGVGTSYAALWRTGPSRTVLVPYGEDATPSARQLARADALFASWLVGRHARTLATQPLRLTDTEHCAPAQKTIALGPPMLAMGALATPVWIVSGDPILAFNAALLLLPLLGALAVFWWVADWTGVPAAGVIAGILYALSPVVLADTAHPFIRDMTWTAFACTFARRLFATGRWRDAIGLAASSSMQLGASSYALIACVFVVPALLVWMFWRYGLRQVRIAQLLLVAAVGATAAAVVLTPYLELRASGDTLQRSAQVFAPWSRIGIGAARYSGLELVLALCALAWRREAGRGDPRLALLASLVLVTLAAAGGRIYAWAAAVLPLFDAIRVVGHVAIGTQLMLCVLAGFGAAALLQRLPRRFATALALVAIAGSFVVTLRPSWLGFAPRLVFESIAARPAEASLELFEQIGELDSGPLVEIPITQISGPSEVRRIAASGWHWRRTSACFGSYLPPERERVRRISAGLPDPDAVDALRRLGFTTLLVHEGVLPLPERFVRASRARDSRLRLLGQTPQLAAFALEPAPGEGVVGSRDR